jgi:uncharacterized protein involved in exopolysaccharide biosynthesis
MQLVEQNTRQSYVAQMDALTAKLQTSAGKEAQMKQQMEKLSESIVQLNKREVEHEAK